MLVPDREGPDGPAPFVHTIKDILISALVIGEDLEVLVCPCRGAVKLSDLAVVLCDLLHIRGPADVGLHFNSHHVALLNCAVIAGLLCGP